MAVLELKSLSKGFDQAGGRLEILKAIDLSIEAGEIVALTGRSGSGKSTLLQISGLLDAPDSGDILVKGQSVAGASDKTRTLLRQKTIGFVYQFHHLLPEFTAVENVVMPLRIRGTSLDEATALAEDILKRVGLGHRLGHKPTELSGGERQRTAIARRFCEGVTI